MASGLDSSVGGLNAGPLAQATGLLAQAIGRDPSLDERAILARTLDLYRAGWGREADMEWIGIAIAVLALTRGVADSAAEKIEQAADKAVAQVQAATRERTWRWRDRLWIAAGLAAAAGVVAGWDVYWLSGGHAWAWLVTYSAWAWPLAIAGALLAVAAMMAAPEIWSRARAKK